MEPEICVSVICNAYNHGLYIRQCLEGLVMQKTDFEYEILVHDDASTDDTADIIRAFAARYPERILPVYQTENQYTRGGIGQFQYPRARGRYIAFCEGDDYWTDPDKLQKQVDALERHPELDICAHAAQVIDAKSGRFLWNIAPSAEDRILPPEEVIAGEGGFVATNSLVYRAALLRDPPQFRRELCIDYTLQIYGSLRGGMLYLKDNMSVYRFETPGSWTVRQKKKDGAAFLEKRRTMLLQLDEYTGGAYRAVIDERLRRNEFEYAWNERKYKDLLDPKYDDYLQALSASDRRKVRTRARFPLLDKLIVKTKTVLRR